MGWLQQRDSRCSEDRRPKKVGAYTKEWPRIGNQPRLVLALPANLVPCPQIGAEGVEPT